MSYIKLGTIVLGLLAVPAFVWASESDELREKAKAVQREAAQLAEQGHREEATNLKRKAMAMLEEAEHLDHVGLDHGGLDHGGLDHGGLDQRRPEILRLKALLEKVRQKEKQLEREAGAEETLSILRREAGEIESKLQTLLKHSVDGPHDEIARRLEHMRIAVDHLNQAGLHDLAEHVAQRAEAAERELHERRQEHGGDAMHEIIKQLDELRHELGQLREEVNKLREKR